ncbi:MAG: citrate/2-methylcitrate synthase [Pseudomonadota bacterium]
MVAKGLEGVVVEETGISDVRAEGVLQYRGVDIADLVDEPFLDVAEWVVTGKRGQSFAGLLAQSANLTAAETAWILALPASTHPMQVLQAMVPVLSGATELGFGEADAGLHVAAKLPAVVATHLLRRPVQMDISLPYAERFLSALGVRDANHIQAFNMTQILQIEHSFNAGTFAARVVASTLASVSSAVAAGIGALSGSLHGGADQDVLEIADPLADEASARAYVRDSLAQGIKLPGMGHREYRVRDPRAECLQQWAEKLALGSEHEHTYLKLVAMEDEFRQLMSAKGKELYANVDFYKGIVYRSIGLPNHFFTAGFAMARVFGYVAHFIESRVDNRIYRPAARYVPRVA